jgi:hypothetical protein
MTEKKRIFSLKWSKKTSQENPNDTFPKYNVAFVVKDPSNTICTKTADKADFMR